MALQVTDYVYGTMPALAPPAGASQPNTGPITGDRDVGDPHSGGDDGGFDIFNDPVFWLVVVAGIATGLIGFRFNWSRKGAGVQIDFGDELAFWLAVPLASIAGILVFKVVASKIEVPGLQQMAAAI